MRKSFVNILIMILLIIPIFSGCGSGEAEDVNIGNTASYVYVGEAAKSLDPSLSGPEPNIAVSNAYETLMKFSSRDYGTEGNLATEYSVSEDGKTWIFRLKQGITFHDDTPFSAEAVKYSVERTLALGAEASKIWDPVDSIEVVSQYEVKFNLKYPAPLDRIASSPYGAFMISPGLDEAGGRDWLEQGHDAGTGAYTIESYDGDSEITLSKYDDYWNEWKEDSIGHVTIRYMSDIAAVVEMMRSGDADIVAGLTAGDTMLFENMASVSLKTYDSFRNAFVFMNMNNEILSIKEVRQAMSYLFPYEYVTRVIMKGNANQAQGIIPGGHLGHGESLLQYEYDPTQANELLEEAGYADGFELLYTYDNEDAISEAIAQAYAKILQSVGIEVELRGMTLAEQMALSQNADLDLRQDLYAMNWESDHSNPESWLTDLFSASEKTAYNMSDYKNPKVDKMTALAYETSSTDIEKADQMYAVLQNIIIDDAPAVNVMDYQSIWAIQDTFAGFRANPNYPGVVFFYDTYRDN